MASSSNANPIEAESTLQSRAFKAISSGIDLDQKHGDLDTILLYYRNGIEDLRQLLRLDRTRGASRLKLEKTFDSVQARILELNDLRKREGSLFSSVNIAPPHLSPIGPLSSAFVDEKPPSFAKRSPSTTSIAAPTSKKSMIRSKEAEQLAHQILDEILLDKPNVSWDSVVGLESAKKALKEIVILPYLRPELFTGLRSPARGVLLFGPPGTGKTMLAKAVATESKAKFFAVSASTLTSKNYGEGEKLVRALFEMARELQPSIIFIDEIDSILTSRSDSEHEASRRLKTEFLLQFDGIGSGSDDKILLLAATNRPQELDQAALRRMVKRIYIPLPEIETRISLLNHLLSQSDHALSRSEINLIARDTDGYSSSDITALARESAMGPIRGLGSRLLSTSQSKIRPINLKDFQDAIKTIRPSVSSSYVEEMLEWNNAHGVMV